MTQSSINVEKNKSERPLPPQVPESAGWSISFYKIPENFETCFNEYQIETDGNNSVFNSDDDVMRFVVQEAKSGSEFHIGVLEFLEQYCPPERKKVRDITGY